MRSSEARHARRLAGEILRSWGRALLLVAALTLALLFILWMLPTSEIPQQDPPPGSIEPAGAHPKSPCGHPTGTTVGKHRDWNTGHMHYTYLYAQWRHPDGRHIHTIRYRIRGNSGLIIYERYYDVQCERHS